MSSDRPCMPESGGSFASREPDTRLRPPLPFRVESLTLTQRQRLEALELKIIRRQVHQHARGVDAGRQQEYQWRFAAGIVQGRVQVHRRRFDEARAEFVGHKVRHGERQPVQPQTPHEQQFLQQVGVLVPFACHSIADVIVCTRTQVQAFFVPLLSRPVLEQRRPRARNLGDSAPAWSTMTFGTGPAPNTQWTTRIDAFFLYLSLFTYF